MPPCGTDTAGRHKLLTLYSDSRKLPLSQYNTVSSNVYTTNVRNLSLKDYCIARKYYCELHHNTKCTQQCDSMINAGRAVLENGVLPLRTVFRTYFPDVTYHSVNAKRLLLQMPLVAVRLQSKGDKRGELFLMEFVKDLDYEKVVGFLNREFDKASGKKTLTKADVRSILSLAQSDRERETISYAVYKASGITSNQAQKHFGLSNMAPRALEVEKSITEVKEIRDAVDNLANTQDSALLATYGIFDEESSNCGSSENESSDELAVDENNQKFSLSDDILFETLKMSEYNWFELVERTEAATEDTFDNNARKELDGFYKRISQFGLTDVESQKVNMSYGAFLAAEDDMQSEERICRIINGEVVTDTESDDPEAYVGLKDDFSKTSLSEASIALVKKKRISIRRRGSRLKAKMIAERRFLSRKCSKRQNWILSKCPDIGNVIEEYVKDNNVGADCWRRTGVLTFDGNTKLKSKVTYESIRQHLQHVYKQHFSYGSVVQLCVARNRRRRSAARYKGVAKVTTRRARKGFNLKYNPDSHWSSAFYRGLNQVQYENGGDILNINCDDASGFRLDTMTTCKQYAAPTVQGCDVNTTRTDYVNKHPSVLQTTSYNFTGTRTTAEACVGVVKAQPLHQKNSAQHASDLKMLSQKPALGVIFNQNGNEKPKSVDCVRVDGASDEGPSHLEVHYWWTEWHVHNKKIATLVTTRSSGSSYLNRVELQNGCLSRGHANTFIPSTLGGSCIDPESGLIDEQKLKYNLDLAIEAYINRVDGCPCGDATLQLFKGSDSCEYQKKSKKLDVFLKGSKKKKEELKREDPESFAEFDRIWTIRNSHMAHGLPSYVFYLYCCYKPDCEHPICQFQPRPESVPTWYSGGPLITHLPFPVPDSSKPWGGTTCEQCKGFCAGHYVRDPVFIDVFNSDSVKSIHKPPSVILKQLFTSCSGPLTSDDSLESAAKECLLPIEEARVWCDHLQTVMDNRRRGTKKAAATRAAKKAQNNNYCGSCGQDYRQAVEGQMWIFCDMCEVWYCCECEKIDRIPETPTYMCIKCCES